MTTIEAEFDGNVFVPVGPVNLPIGSKVTIPLPQVPQPREPTPADQQRWAELMRELNATEPYFPTVEDALGQMRGRPGYDL